MWCDVLCLPSVLLAEASGELLLGVRYKVFLCISLPKVSEPGKLGEWSSPSTSFVDLSGSSGQHGVGSESIESDFRRLRTSLPGFELVTSWPLEQLPMGDIWVFPLKLSCGCLRQRSRGPGLCLWEAKARLVFKAYVSMIYPHCYRACLNHSAC